jgi:hypothetical protein
MGYTFQKLYANNYMSWSKNGIFIFKKGSDITHGNINLFKLIRFLKGNPVVRQNKETGRFSFFKFHASSDGYDYDYYPFTEENLEKLKVNNEKWHNLPKNCSDELVPLIYGMESVGRDMMEQLQELSDLGWYELVEEKA